MLKRLSTIVLALTARTFAGRTRKKHLPALWVMSDAARLPDPSALVAALPTRSAVIVRHPAATERRLLAHATRLRARPHKTIVLISEDWRAAAALGLEGVHIPERRVPCISPGLRIWRRQTKALLTASAHSAKGLRAAQRARCDMVFLSPVFATASHPERVSLGRVRFAALTRQVNIQVAALGGINYATVRQLNGSGFAAIAGVGFANAGKD